MQRLLSDDFAFLFLGQSFIIAQCAVIVSGIRNGYSVLGADLIIIPIFSKSFFAYRKVTPFGLTLVTLHSIMSAIDAF